MCVGSVKLRWEDSGQILKAIALLDRCSQDNFLRERLFINLALKGRKTLITIKTLDWEVKDVTIVVNKLHVVSGTKDSHDWLQLPCTYAKKYIPVDKDNFASSSNLKQWKHLKGIFCKISKNHHISFEKIAPRFGANWHYN